MNKIRNVLVFLIALLFASSAWAVGSIVIESDSLTSGSTSNIRIINYLVTFDAAGVAPTAVALDDIVKSAGGLAPSVKDWWIMEVDILFGSTAPTDNSDLYLYRYTGTNRIDVLGESHPGDNEIVSATDSHFVVETITRPLLGTELITISGNSVANATCNIIFTLYK